MSGVDGVSGAARRRRDRRLCAWWRHKEFRVKAAVVSALHHSSGQCSASRRLKVAVSCGSLWSSSCCWSSACRVWHRMVAWIGPRFGSSVIWWPVLRALVVMSRKLRCPCLKSAGLKLVGLGTLLTPTGQFSGSGTRDLSSTAGVSHSVFGSSSSGRVAPTLVPHQREPNHCLRVGFDAVSPVVSPWMPIQFCMHLFTKGGCRNGDLCTFAHSLSELHPDADSIQVECALACLNDVEESGWCSLTMSVDCVRDGVGLAGAWHPRASSWVPLPVARGRFIVLGLGTEELGIPYPFAAETVFVGGTGSLFCLAEVMVVLCGVSLAEVMSASAASVPWSHRFRGRVFLRVPSSFFFGEEGE